MKTYKCPNCHKIRETENDVNIKYCGCGEFMICDTDIKECEVCHIKNEFVRFEGSEEKFICDNCLNNF